MKQCNCEASAELRDSRLRHKELEYERDAAVVRAAEAESQLAAANAERERLRDAVVSLLKSAHPHPVEHPTMWAAWRNAEAALSAADPPAPELAGSGDVVKEE